SFLCIVQSGKDGSSTTTAADGTTTTTTTTKFGTSLTYLVMTHAGTAFITAFFLLMFSQTGSFSFDSFADWSSSASAATPMPQVLNIKNAAFVLGFIGFGIKAGM